jgi:hypothetical protein
MLNLSFAVHAKISVNIHQVEQFLPGAVAADAVPVLPARGLHAGLAQAQLALRPLQPVPQNIQCMYMLINYFREILLIEKLYCWYLQTSPLESTAHIKTSSLLLNDKYLPKR